MTKQEIFNEVWNWFIVDKQPKSVSEKGACMYRGDNGKRCAMGIFVEDGEYDPTFEGGSVDILLGHNISRRLREFVGSNLSILEVLQIAHDSASDNPDEFHASVCNKLTRIARNNKLVIPDSVQEDLTGVTA